MSGSRTATSFQPVAKGDPYYANKREDVVDRLRRPLGRVLDVGCGAGALGPGLRDAGATEIVGIEIEPSAAARAREVIDDVIARPVEEAIESLSGRFDTVLCLDVLEHLVRPGEVLRRLRGIAGEGAVLQVSVPNARHFSLVRDLVVRGTFGYADWGHRDDTHLRWFTRHDLVDLVSGAGWTVICTSWPPLGRSAWLHRLTRGRSSEFLVAQIYLSARNGA